jgi:hypothetical protein
VRRAAGDQQQHRGPRRRADELGDPVEHHLLGAHPARHEGRQADRRIDVAARDRTDAIGHGDDREAERQGYAKLSDMVAAQHRRAAAEQDKSKGADELGNKF